MIAFDDSHDDVLEEVEIPERVLRLEEVEKVVGLSRYTIYRMEKKGQFPKRRQLSPGTVGHLQSEVLEWLRSRPKAW